MKKKVFLGFAAFALAATSALAFQGNKVHAQAVDENYGIATCALTDTQLKAYARANLNHSDSTFKKYFNLYYYTMCDGVKDDASRQFINEGGWACNTITDKDEMGFTTTTYHYYTEFTNNTITLEAGKLYYIFQYDDCFDYWQSEQDVATSFAELYSGFSTSKCEVYFSGTANEMTTSKFYTEGDEYTQAMANSFKEATESLTIGGYQGSSDVSAYMGIVIPSEDMTLNARIHSYDEECQDEWGISLYIEEYSLLPFEADVVAPDFTNTDYNIPVNVNSPASTASILSNIYALDDTDGDVSGNVTLVSTTYDPNNLVLGKHPFNVKVSDSAGNSTEATFYVHVYDIDKPSISGTNSYSISYTETLTEEQIRSSLTASDNFDSNLTINVKSDNYSANMQKVGQYQIVYTTTDTAGNTSEDYTVTISVGDKVAPVITAPSTMECSNTALLSIDEIKNKISVIDGSDGAIDYIISGYEEYKANYQDAGQFTLKVAATDSSNNSAEFTITLNVSDSVTPNLFVTKDYVISVAKGEALTNEQILNFLVQVGEVNQANYDFMDCKYQDEEGTYEVAVFMKDGSIYKTSIVVGNPEAEEENGNWWTEMWEAVGNWWSDMWSGIWDWIKGLFTSNKDDEETKDETVIAAEPQRVIEDEIIDDQFIVYELEPMDPDAGVPATMPDDFNMPMLG